MTEGTGVQRWQAGIIASTRRRGERITEAKRLKGRPLRAEGNRGFTSTFPSLIRGLKNGVHLTPKLWPMQKLHVALFLLYFQA